MNLFGGKPKKPQSDTEILMQAIAGVKQREDRKHRTMERKIGGGAWKRFLDTRILVGILIILGAFLADGVRRENAEFEATITELLGQVFVQPAANQMAQPAELKQKLVDGNIVGTAVNSSASLSFPDGSVLVVGPGSNLTINLIEYNRGGAWRSRSFFLRVGQLWAKVSPRYGAKSELKIYTASSVAAVRGTVFSVEQNREGTKSQVACAQGQVAVAGFTGNPTWCAEGTATDVERGLPPERAKLMNLLEKRPFMRNVLWTVPPEAGFLQKTELACTQFFNAPMTILGIGKCGWAFGAIDSTRTSAAMEAMRRLQVHLEGSASYPEFVNPVTLEELNLPEEYREQILNNLHGHAIMRYDAIQGGRDYLIYAQARDKARTLFKLTSIGVQRGTKEEQEMVM